VDVFTIETGSLGGIYRRGGLPFSFKLATRL